MLKNEKISFFLLAIYSFTCWFSISLANLSLIGLLTVFIYEKYQSYKKSSPRKSSNSSSVEKKFFYLFMLFYVYLCFNCAYSVFILKFSPLKQINSLMRCMQLFLFIIIGHFLYKHAENIEVIIVIAIVGILIGLILNQDWSKWSMLLHGIRSGTNKWPYWTMGLYSATGLFCSAFVPKIFFKNNLLNRTIKLIFITMFSLFLIASQNRATWIAVAVLIIFLCMISYRYRMNHLKIITTTSIIILAMMLINFNSVKKRYIIRLDTKYDNIIIPVSLKIRLSMSLFGIKKWTQHPFLGWGIGVNAKLLANKNNKIILKHPHLHSNYLELLVRTGIIGLFMFMFINIYTIRLFFISWKKGISPDHIFLILVSVIVLLTITSLTDFRLFHRDFRFYYVFFWGIMYSYILTMENKKNILNAAATIY